MNISTARHCAFGLVFVLNLAAAEPLSLHPDNPHYFLFRGKPTILIGSTEHYGAVLNLDFDNVKYLDALQKDGLNVTRSFSGIYVEPPGSFKIAGNTLSPGPGRLLCPFARSAEAGYKNGGNKFDLDKWDDAYFVRLKEFVKQAGARGIVVEVVLFCPYYEDSMWVLSPLHPGNNVNHTPDVPRTEVWALKHEQYTAIQDRMARKFADELKEFDNVYFELCNEPYFGGVTLEFQKHIAETLNDAEKDFPKHHLLAQNIANVKAKIKDPNPAVSLFNFHYATPPDTVGMNYALNKAIGDDETGFKGNADFTYRQEAWNFILAGGALFDHLDYSFTAGHEAGDFKYPKTQPGGGGVEFRAQMKVLKEFIDGFEFVKMAPHPEVVAGIKPEKISARVLAELGKQYAIYVQGGTKVELTLNVPEGEYEVTWVRTKPGVASVAERVKSDGKLVVTSPEYAEDIAVRVVRK